MTKKKFAVLALLFSVLANAMGARLPDLPFHAPDLGSRYWNRWARQQTQAQIDGLRHPLTDAERRCAFALAMLDVVSAGRKLLDFGQPGAASAGAFETAERQMLAVVAQSCGGPNDPRRQAASTALVYARKSADVARAEAQRALRELAVMDGGEERLDPLLSAVLLVAMTSPGALPALAADRRVQQALRAAVSAP